jgi:hypothetical protein
LAFSVNILSLSTSIRTLLIKVANIDMVKEINTIAIVLNGGVVGRKLLTNQGIMSKNPSGVLKSIYHLPLINFCFKTFKKDILNVHLHL